MDENRCSERLQFADYVDDAGVADVGAIFLEGEAQHDHGLAVHLEALQDHALDGLFGDVLPHAVIDFPARENDLRVIAHGHGLVGEVVGVYSDAMPAHEAGTKGQEIPLRAGRLEDFQGVDADFMEDDRQLVHQRDIEVTLRVFDHLRSFGHLDRAGAIHAGRHDTAVDLGDAIQRRGRIPRDDLHDPGQRVLPVARVDALRRIPDEEILFPFQAGMAFELRHADFFGGAGIDRGLEHDDGAAPQVLPDMGTCA